MFLYPFHDFAEEEITMFAIGNKDMSNNPLHIHRIEVSAAEPILFELYVVSAKDLVEGEDVKELVVTSRVGSFKDLNAFDIQGYPEIVDIEAVKLMKNKVIKYEATLLDETDGVSLDPKSYIAMRVTSNFKEPIEFAGNVLWQYLT